MIPPRTPAANAEASLTAVLTPEKRPATRNKSRCGESLA